MAPGTTASIAKLLFVGSLFCMTAISHDFDRSNAYAVILSASRYWFNYRHTSGALAAYDIVRRLGVPDERIVLFLAEDHAWDPRNPYTGSIFHVDGDRHGRGYPDDIDVDYVGSAVSPESFVRAITGRHRPGRVSRGTLQPPPDRTASLLVYFTGHGGEGFLKFHDKEELTYADLGHAIHDAWLRGRFGRALVIADTCQAGSAGEWVHTPGVTMLASSVTGQNSYATGRDDEIGLALADGFTRAVHDILQRELWGTGQAGPTKPGAGQQAVGALAGQRHRWRDEALEAAMSTRAQAGLGSVRPVGPLRDLCRSSPGNISAAVDTGADPTTGALAMSTSLQRACARLQAIEEVEARQPWSTADSSHIPIAAGLWGHGHTGAAGTSPQPGPSKSTGKAGNGPDKPLYLTLASFMLPEWRVSSTVNALSSWMLGLIGPANLPAGNGAMGPGGTAPQHVPGLDDEPALRYLSSTPAIYATG